MPRCTMPAPLPTKPAKQESGMDHHSALSSQGHATLRESLLRMPPMSSEEALELVLSRFQKV